MGVSLGPGRASLIEKGRTDAIIRGQERTRGAATVQDLDANELDGEFSGSFPSGDGTAGGDFVAEFTVDGIQPTLQSIQDNVFTPICSGCHT